MTGRLPKRTAVEDGSDILVIIPLGEETRADGVDDDYRVVAVVCYVVDQAVVC